jgi:hypothetical protein
MIPNIYSGDITDTDGILDWMTEQVSNIIIINTSFCINNSFLNFVVVGFLQPKRVTI